MNLLCLFVYVWSVLLPTGSQGNFLFMLAALLACWFYLHCAAIILVVVYACRFYMHCAVVLKCPVFILCSSISSTLCLPLLLLSVSEYDVSYVGVNTLLCWMMWIDLSFYYCCAHLYPAVAVSLVNSLDVLCFCCG